MVKAGTKLARARAKLERKLAGGWERAVFATPQREDGSRDERVVEARAGMDFADLWREAESAAAEGLVKHSYVIDVRRRLDVDARHGHVKQRTLDQATLDKVMGGKDRALRPDRSATLLRAIGIMNADGSISARSAKKYKQVNHLVELCRPVWAAIAEHPERKRLERDDADAPLRVVDLACGNSYLSFVLLEALRLDQVPAVLLGVDLREDVVETSRERAREIGFASPEAFEPSSSGDDSRWQARFERASLEQLDPAELERRLGGSADLALSLHACDTATDAALFLAITAGVRSILCVPCCQAEVARQLEGVDRASSPAAAVPAILDHGLLRRGLGELITDGLRVEVLAACGYTVSVLEFVASKHTPKNLLIRATLGEEALDAETRAARLAPVRERCAALGVAPKLLELL